MLGTHKLTSCLPRAGALHQKSWHPSVLALRPESFFDGLGTRLGPLEAENGETPPALSLDSFKRRGRSGLWAGTTLGAHPLQNRSPGPSWDPSRQALRPARTSRGPSAGPRTPRSWILEKPPLDLDLLLPSLPRPRHLALQKAKGSVPVLQQQRARRRALPQETKPPSRAPRTHTFFNFALQSCDGPVQLVLCGWC